MNLRYLSPVGESCVAIPRVGSLKGYSMKIYGRVWEGRCFIVTDSTFLATFSKMAKIAKMAKIEKMAKKLPNQTAAIFLEIWSGVL